MKKMVKISEGDFGRYDVKVLRPGDVGFADAASGCLPPEKRLNDPPKPHFFESCKVRR